MPIGWLIACTVVFFAAMAAVKAGAAFAIETWGLWTGIAFTGLMLLIGLLIDRSDKKKRDRIND